MGGTQGFDVVVVGSGIAGVSAAIEAARAGARVALASLGATFSGSSFYGGTWGLGLVGPAGEADVDDFVDTICTVGRHMADPALVRALVSGVEPAVRWLEGMGVELRRPTDPGQQAYIPCFDHKSRGWHGLGRASLRTAWGGELARLGVTALPNTELVELEERDGRVRAALLAARATGEVTRVPCGALVLAAGGLAGLYERCLTAADTCGSAHGIALAHGCALVNSEFLQIMAGLVAPVAGVVVNEKAFRFSTLGLPAALLEERSGYGPFTCRLASHAVDEAIMAAGPAGLALSYRLPDEVPELVGSYFSWLRGAFGIEPDDEVRVALFAHASNGGIAIDAQGRCAGGPEGLFACGECAGGMHGADRIGGLASAAALVFGRAAGRAAAKSAGRGHGDPSPIARIEAAKPQIGAMTAALRAAMSAHALVGRTADGLGAARRELRRIGERLDAPAQVEEGAPVDVASLRLRHQLSSANVMLRAMELREESRGAHHRADHDAEDPRQAVPRTLRLPEAPVR